jgi:hypothetical protein
MCVEALLLLPLGSQRDGLPVETLIGTSKEVGLEVNAEKTKYMLLSRHQNAGQNYNVKIHDRSFENVAVFGNDSNKSKFNTGGN